MTSLGRKARGEALDLPEVDVRTIAERFIGVCYDDLGIEPKRLDGQDMHGALGHVLPGRFKRAEPLAEQVPTVLRAYIAHLEATHVVTNAFELKKDFESLLAESIAAARARPEASLSYMTEHAAELDTTVLWRHVDTFVNQFSLDLGEQGQAAVVRLEEMARAAGVIQ